MPIRLHGRALSHIIRLSHDLSTQVFSRDLFYLSPQNINQERARFLSDGRHRAPRFAYPTFPLDLSTYRNYALELVHYHGEYEGLVHQYAKRSSALISMLMSLQRGEPIKSRDAEALYGLPDAEAVRAAERILSVPFRRERGAQLSPREVRAAIAPLIRSYGWKVRLSPMLSKMKVSPVRQTLYIASDARFTRQEVERLKVHEIGVHIIRAQHQALLDFPLKELFNPIEVEEGLAYKMEEMHGVLSSEQEHIYAARLIAVAKGRVGFPELFSLVRGYGFSPEDAFTITARAKRGILDTAQPGGLTRDHVYLSGKLAVEKYLAGGGTLEALFVGKAGLSDLPYLAEAQGHDKGWAAETYSPKR